jgi:hypothetical protein
MFGEACISTTLASSFTLAESPKTNPQKIQYKLPMEQNCNMRGYASAYQLAKKSSNEVFHDKIYKN